MKHDHAMMMVFTHVPDTECAKRIAEALIKSKLAACVNIQGPCVSFYHWQGQLAETTEIPIAIKTQQRAYSQVETMLLSMHPYELPEIIALHVDGGLPQFLQWVDAQISPWEPND